jgi:hypothetical protein
MDPDCYTYTAGATTILTAFGPAPCQAAGAAIRGGSAEVRIQPDGATITAHGAPGARTISLPDNQRITMDYAGPDPKTVTLNPAGRKE